MLKQGNHDGELRRDGRASPLIPALSHLDSLPFPLAAVFVCQNRESLRGLRGGTCGGGGGLDQWLGVGVLLRVSNPDPV